MPRRKTEEQLLIDSDDITDVYSVDENEFVNPEQIKTNADVKLDNFLNALESSDDNTYILIKRQLGSGQSSMEHITKVPVDKYDYPDLIEFLRVTYGPGDYRFQIFKTGRRGMIANKLESIAAPLKQSNINQQNSSGNNTNEIVMVMLEKMDQMQQQNIEMMNRMFQQNQSQTSGGNSRQEMMQDMILMKELMGGNAAPPVQVNAMDQLTETMGLMSKFKEMGVLGGIVDAPETSVMDVAEKFIPLINKALDSSANQPQPKTGSKPTQKTGKNDMNLMVKFFVNKLVTAASDGDDTESWAETTINNAGREKAKEILGDPDALKKLASQVPGVKANFAWFEDMAEHVKGQLDLPSKYSDLYKDDESVIYTDNQTPESDNADQEKASEIR